MWWNNPTVLHGRDAERTATNGAIGPDLGVRARRVAAPGLPPHFPQFLQRPLLCRRGSQLGFDSAIVQLRRCVR